MLAGVRMWWSLRINIVQQLYCYAYFWDRKDRMSMYSGLEVRVPFCDHQLLEYVWNIPWEMKSRDGVRKLVLRDAALRRGMSRHSAPHGDSAGTGTAKRPHARRGHWHHYWAGPRNARQLILKWTAQTFVHPEAGREDNVVAIKVK